MVKTVQMAPTGEGQGLSARRAQFAGPSGLKGIISNGKTSAIATFAALGGFVYGCESWTSIVSRHVLANLVVQITKECLVKF